MSGKLERDDCFERPVDESKSYKNGREQLTVDKS